MIAGHCLRQAIGCARNLLEALCRDSSEEEAREADRIRSGPTKRRLGQSVSAALSPPSAAREMLGRGYGRGPKHQRHPRAALSHGGTIPPKIMCGWLRHCVGNPTDLGFR